MSINNSTSVGKSIISFSAMTAVVAVLRMPPTLQISFAVDPIPEVKRKDSYNDSGECDSGCEADGFIPPTSEQAERIVNQLEEYFSDEHLAKDTFLLKHVRRTREGYVSIKLVSSFKKLKHLCRDWRQVAWSVRHYSTQLQLNSESTKVRRNEPLPSTLSSQASPRYVIALSLPPERSTVDTIAEVFAPYGPVTFIRTLRPNCALPQELKPHAAKFPALTTSLCALIEFEKGDAAQKAVRGVTEFKVQIVSKEPANNNSNKKPTPPSRTREDSSGSDEDRRVIHLALPRRKSASWCEPASPQLSPWLKRRMEARRQSHDGRQSPSGLSLNENIVRNPKGPDGSKGFTPGYRIQLKRTVVAVC